MGKGHLIAAGTNVQGQCLSLFQSPEQKGRKQNLVFLIPVVLFQEVKVIVANIRALMILGTVLLFFN